MAACRARGRWTRCCFARDTVREGALSAMRGRLREGAKSGSDSHLMNFAGDVVLFSKGGISTMADRLRLSSLIPAGLIVERTAEAEGILVVSARATVDERVCPLCRRPSRRIFARSL